ncbi:hypothetical protein SAMN06295888_1449 [Desulfonatronum zhilinae]|nr:hypothetical protein SAMN06295888_1449 [Desulfonatronum zhilinae]
MEINKFVKASAADKEEHISDALNSLEELWMDDQLEEAEALANTLLRLLNPASKNYYEYQLSIYETLGDIYLNTDMYALAEQTFQKLLTTKELRNRLLPYQYADTHKSLGEALYKKGKYLNALFTLDKAKALFEMLDRKYNRQLDELEITRSYLLAELGYTDQAWETFLIAISSFSVTPIDNMEKFLEGYIQFAEHSNNAGNNDRAKRFASAAIKCALDYHKRISEHLVTAFRNLATYHGPADPKKAQHLMQTSCDLVKHLAIVQGFALTDSDTAA